MIARFMIASLAACSNVVAPYSPPDDLSRVLPDISEDEIALIENYIAEQYDGIDVLGHSTDSTGTVFDCVAPDRQPGLRGYSDSGEIYFRELEEIADISEGMVEHEQLVDGEELALPDLLDCPSGTVAIKMPSFEEIAQFGSLQEYLELYYPLPTITVPHDHAVLSYSHDNTGGSGYFNIWNPYVAADGGFSLSQIWVVRGSSTDLQTVEAGWQDSPTRNGSNLPKLFVYTTQDGYGPSGCYDQDFCNDWVQLSATISPGIGWINHSVFQGSQYSTNLKYDRNDVSGSWYLYFDGTIVGYYPNNLFDSAGLATKAALVQFGGEVAGDNFSAHTATNMGSGSYATQGFQQAAYIRDLKYMTYAATPVNTEIPYASTTTILDVDPDCYSVDSAFSSTAGWRTHVYHGGPGNYTGCP